MTMGLYKHFVHNVDFLKVLHIVCCQNSQPIIVLLYLYRLAIHIYAPFEEGGAYCFAHVRLSVSLSVGMSVSLNLVQLITQERFAPEASGR